MAILVNRMNREVKVIIPNMREFRSFYSDNEGVIGMFFKRDWREEKQEEHWKPTDEQMASLSIAQECVYADADRLALELLYNDLKKLM